jgi:hypothetical protein
METVTISFDFAKLLIDLLDDSQKHYNFRCLRQSNTFRVSNEDYASSYNNLIKTISMLDLKFVQIDTLKKDVEICKSKQRLKTQVQNGHDLLLLDISETIKRCKQRNLETS